MNSNLREYIEKNSKKNDANLKYDFMPDMLEVIERPAHKAGSVIIWTIFGLIVFVILWATFSKVEVVVSAKGNIVPLEEETVISAGTRYDIISIKVEDGQHVKEGELLVELSAKEIEKDKQELEGKLLDSKNILEIYNKIIANEDVDSIDIATYDKSIQGEIENIINEHKSTYTLIKQYKDSNFKTQAKELEEDYREKINQSARELNISIEEQEKSLVETNKLIEAANIVAPFDGIVYEIFIDIKDIVVSKDEPVVSVIREDTGYEMECYVNNNDIADIEINQKVNLKLDAYPYGDYGTIDGIVTFVGAKTTPIDGMGNMVLIKVAITDTDYISKVFPGLTGTADMIIGERRIIEYFIGTITDALKESIREK